MSPPLPPSTPPPTSHKNSIWVSSDDQRIARYAAAAIVLSIAEAAIPMPLPGIKPGVSNIVVLIVLMRYGWRDAAWVAILRVFAAGLLMGQFLTPGFMMSLCGAVASLGMLALCKPLMPAPWFGPVGFSVVAAFAHIGAQFALARMWLVPHDGIYALWPIFSAMALLFGMANGLVAAHCLAETAAPETCDPPVGAPQNAEDAKVHEA